MSEGLTNEQLLKNISALLENAWNKVVVAVNQTIVLTYFEIGRMIVEDEQHGESRAEYGKEQLKFLSKNLTKKFGKGFSETNLKQMRQFFLSYSICQTLSDESESLDTIQQSPLVRYTLPENNEQIFASKYFTVLPSKEDFINILNSDNGKIS